MGALFSKRVSASRRPSQIQPNTDIIDRQRSFSIYPEDWAGKHYSEVVTFLKGKYPNAHVTTQAEKESTCDLTFTRPVSFEEGDTHIIVVYNCYTNQIMGFFEVFDNKDYSSIQK